MKTIAFFLIFTFFVFLIFKLGFFHIPKIKRVWLAVAFSAKILTAFILVQFFANQPLEKSDIYRFYDDAIVLNRCAVSNTTLYIKIIAGIDTGSEDYKKVIAHTNSWDRGKTPSFISNNRLIIRYLSIINHINFGSYFISVLYTLFLSFLGIFMIFKILVLHFSGKRWMFYFAIFYTPSLLFWTSGLLKESLLIFLIGLVINCGYFALLKRKPIPRILLVLVGFCLIFNLRAIIAILMIISLLPFVFNLKFKKWNPVTTYFIMFFLVVTFVSESGKIRGINFWDEINQKRTEFIAQANDDKSGSLFSNELYGNTAKDKFRAVGSAFINVIFRPFPNEIHNISSLLAFIESSILILLFVGLSFFIDIQKIHINLLLMLLSFSLSYMLIIGLSTPISGAISRYKSIPLLFFEIAIIISINSKNILEFTKNMVVKS